MTERQTRAAMVGAAAGGADVSAHDRDVYDDDDGEPRTAVVALEFFRDGSAPRRAHGPFADAAAAQEWWHRNLPGPPYVVILEPPGDV